jgi:hypothetical protein
MAKKHTKFIPSAAFDDIEVIGINTNLVDYKLAWSLNDKLKFDFVKYRDITSDESSQNRYSFYFYEAGENLNAFNLVSLKSQGKYWIKTATPTDYLLVIRNHISNEQLNELLKDIKSIKNVVFAQRIDLLKVKKIDAVLETIELHESDILEEIYPRFVPK